MKVAQKIFDKLNKLDMAWFTVIRYVGTTTRVIEDYSKIVNSTGSSKPGLDAFHELARIIRISNYK